MTLTKAPLASAATVRAVEEAKEHIAEAKKWGYSPDPWAPALLELAEIVGPLVGPHQVRICGEHYQLIVLGPQETEAKRTQPHS